MAEMKIRFPLRTQVPESTRSVGVGLNILDIFLKQERADEVVRAWSESVE